jgi:hypothetical protein
MNNLTIPGTAIKTLPPELGSPGTLKAPHKTAINKKSPID